MIIERSILLRAILCFVAIHSAATAQDQLPSPVTAPDAAATSDADSFRNELNALRARIAALEATPTDSPATKPVNFEMTQPEQTLNSPGNAVTPSVTRPFGNWEGGVSVYVLMPHWTGGNASSVVGNILTTSFTQQNFDNSLAAAPAFWFGYTDDSGYGLRTGFFNYNQSWSTSNVTPAGLVQLDPTATTLAGPGDPFFASGFLNITSWDAEASKRLDAWDWSWTATAGIRYLHLAEGYNALSATSTSVRHSFNGWGPTMSLGGRRPVGSSGLGVYGNCRGALVFGQQKNSAVLDDGLGDVATQSANNLTIIPMAQCEFGVDYRQPIRNGQMMLLVETGMVAQAYFDAGSPSSMAPITFSGLGAATSSSADSTLGLFGLRSSIGIAF